MEIPSKVEVNKKKAENNKAHVEAGVKLIVAAMEKPDNIYGSYSFSMGQFANRLVVEEIVKLFKDKGWDAKICSGQYNEADYLSIS